MLILMSLAGLSTAWADPSPADPPAAPEAPVPAPIAPAAAKPTVQELADALRDSDADRVEQGRVRGVVEAILAAADVLVDDRQPLDARIAAAATLGTTGDVRVLPFLRVGAQLRIADLQFACLDAAFPYKDEDAVAIARWIVRDPATDGAVKRAALDHLAEMGQFEGAHGLWELAGDRAVADVYQSEARRLLAERYPDEMATLGAPVNVSDFAGAAVGVLANGFAGGVMLGAVGSYGKFDGAVAIGATGGALIGLGTGLLYVKDHPVTRGEGLAYGSGVGWGYTFGHLGSQSLVGAAGHDDWRTPREQERAWDARTGAWALGSLGGGVVGVLAARREPGASDVLELDTAAYLGSAFALSAIDLAYRPDLATQWNWNDCPYSYYGGYYAYDCHWEEREKIMWSRSRVRAGVTAGGAALGMGAGLLLARDWKLDPEDALFAGVVGGEAAWVGFFWPAAVGLDDSELSGTVRLPLHASVAGALAFAEWRPVSPLRSGVGAFGAVMGNAIGAGLPIAARKYDEQPVAQTMVPLGIAGTAAGMLAAPWLAPDGDDWAMIGIGTPIVAAETGAITAWLNHRGVVEDRQTPGFALLTSGLAGTGLLVAGKYVDVPYGTSALIGTSALWGSYYGVLVPIAVDSSGDDADLGLTGAIVADVFMAGGAVLVGPGHVRPGDTVVPQIGGVTGATLGALGAALFTDHRQAVAAGAVVGSALGLGTGAVIEAVGHGSDVHVALPTLDLPGIWLPSAGPTVLDDGSMGVRVGLTATGW